MALQLSEQEYKDSYLQIVQNPQFPEMMRKVEAMMKNKDPELKNIKEIEFKNLEKLYLMDYCKRNQCKILFGDIQPAELYNTYNSKMRFIKLYISYFFFGN